MSSWSRRGKSYLNTQQEDFINRHHGGEPYQDVSLPLFFTDNDHRGVSRYQKDISVPFFTNGEQKRSSSNLKDVAIPFFHNTDYGHKLFKNGIQMKDHSSNNYNSKSLPTFFAGWQAGGIEDTESNNHLHGSYGYSRDAQDNLKINKDNSNSSPLFMGNWKSGRFGDSGQSKEPNKNLHGNRKQILRRDATNIDNSHRFVPIYFGDLMDQHSKRAYPLFYMLPMIEYGNHLEGDKASNHLPRETYQDDQVNVGVDLPFVERERSDSEIGPFIVSQNRLPFIGFSRKLFKGRYTRSGRNINGRNDIIKSKNGLSTNNFKAIKAIGQPQQQQEEQPRPATLLPQQQHQIEKVKQKQRELKQRKELLALVKRYAKMKKEMVKKNTKIQSPY